MGREQGGTVEARRGFFPVVRGDDVAVEQAFATVVGARRDASVRQGGAQWLAAAHDLHVREGGGAVMVAGRRLDVDRGGGAVLAAADARVKRSVVGMVVGARVTLEDSRVVLSPAASTVVGVAVGVVVGLAVSAALRRRASGTDPEDGADGEGEGEEDLEAPSVATDDDRSRPAR